MPGSKSTNEVFHPYSCAYNPELDVIPTRKKRDSATLWKPPSASKIGRDLSCLAATVLPGVDSKNPFSDRGIAVHRFCADTVVRGRDYALARVAPAHQEFCAIVDTKTLLERAAGATPEVAFGYGLLTGEGRLIGSDIGRNYGGRKTPDEMFGSSDYFRKVELDAFISDVKVMSGHDSYAPLASENWQLRSLALAAARATGCTSATLEIWKLHNDGQWADPDVHRLDILDLDEGAETLRKFAERAQSAWSAYRDFHEVPTPVEGSHCAWCPSAVYCPAKTALIQAAAGNPLSLEAKISALSPATAGQVWTQMLDLERMLYRVKDAIKEMATQNPIPLPSGKVLAPSEVNRESVDGGAVFETLESMCGREIANRAVEVNSSKEAIKRAIRPVAETRGVPMAQLEREVMARLRSIGGVKMSTTMQVKEVKGDAAHGDR